MDMEDSNNPFAEGDLSAELFTNIDSYFIHHQQSAPLLNSSTLQSSSVIDALAEGDDDTTSIKIRSTEVISGVTYYTVSVQENDKVNRRYSDFQSFRSCLVKWFPSKIIPNIPDKHSLKDYLNTSKKSHHVIIEYRKRKFESWLQYLVQDPLINQSELWCKFLDLTESSWAQVLRRQPFTQLPHNVLLSSCRDPLSPVSPYLMYIPLPPMSLLKKFDNSLLQQVVFKPLNSQILNYHKQLHNLDQQLRKLIAILKDSTRYKRELGANFNVFSLLDTSNLNNLQLEKIGQAIDMEFINLEILINKLVVSVKEPLQDWQQLCGVLLKLLQFRKYKELQLQLLKRNISIRQLKCQKLISMEFLHLKLDSLLTSGVPPPTPIPQETPDTDDEEISFINTEDVMSELGSFKQPKHKRSLFKLFNNDHSPAPQNFNDRFSEIVHLKQELQKLQQCHDELLQDTMKLDHDVELSCIQFLQKIKLGLLSLLLQLENVMVRYCVLLNHWESAAIVEGQG